MDALLAGIQYVADFFGGDAAGHGIGGFFSQWWADALRKLTVWYIKAKIASIKFGWQTASGVLADLQVSQQITSGLSALPIELRNVMNFLRVPESITNLLTAYTTRFVLRLIPGL